MVSRLQQFVVAVGLLTRDTGPWGRLAASQQPDRCVALEKVKACTRRLASRFIETTIAIDQEMGVVSR